MFEREIYRKKLGPLLKTCMVCDAALDTKQAKEYGLCRIHRKQIIVAPHPMMRNFGKGREFQLFWHTDELDDILFRLEHGRDPNIIPDAESDPDAEPAAELSWPASSPYLIYAHYIARIFLHNLPLSAQPTSFDFITFADSCYISMELIFSEMGYLAKRKDGAKLFLNDELHYLMQESYLLPPVAGKRVLLLDLYRSYDTRACIDRLKLSGAREVVTVYMTSYS